MGDAPPAATCTAWDFSADACKAAKDEMAASTGRAFYANEFGGLGCYLYTGESVGYPEEGKGKGTTYFGFGAGTETNPVNPDGTYMSLPEHLPDLGPPEEGRTAVPGYPRCAEYDYAKVPGFYDDDPSTAGAPPLAFDTAGISYSDADPPKEKVSYTMRGAGYEVGLPIKMESDEFDPMGGATDAPHPCALACSQRELEIEEDRPCGTTSPTRTTAKATAPGSEG